MIPEDGRALFLLPGADEEIFEAVAEENIVPKDQAGVASWMKSAARRNA